MPITRWNSGQLELLETRKYVECGLNQPICARQRVEDVTLLRERVRVCLCRAVQAPLVDTDARLVISIDDDRWSSKRRPAGTI